MYTYVENGGGGTETRTPLFTNNICFNCLVLNASYKFEQCFSSNVHLFYIETGVR